VLEEVRCVLEVCSGAASNNSKEAAASVPASLSTLVDSILGARNITTLGQAVAALCAVTGGMKEVVVKNRGKEQEKDKKLDFNGLHKEVLDKVGWAGQDRSPCILLHDPCCLIQGPRHTLGLRHAF
jgi:hypothetical protein